MVDIKPVYDETAVTVVALCGSLRPGSYTRLALKTALIGAGEAGARTHLLDLAGYDLPACDGRPRDAYPPGVGRLRRQVQSAQGILLGTPEYHGGYSGVLKNALDLMGFQEFEGKIVGLVGVSEGGLGAVKALDGLRTVARSLRAWVIPQQISIPRVQELFNAAGYLKSGHLEAHVRAVGHQVTHFAQLRRTGPLDRFITEWEQAQPNPGAEPSSR